MHTRTVSLSHFERVKDGLASAAFFGHLEGVLKQGGVQKGKTLHFSRGGEYLRFYIIEGYIGLLISHRDYILKMFPHLKFPFLPWLYSTEVCEHLFGECRKLVKDFSFADFIYMVPKLHVLMEAAMKLETITKEKATARAGQVYTHLVQLRRERARAACTLPIG